MELSSLFSLPFSLKYPFKLSAVALTLTTLWSDSAVRLQCIASWHENCIFFPGNALLSRDSGERSALALNPSWNSGQASLAYVMCIISDVLPPFLIHEHSSVIERSMFLCFYSRTIWLWRYSSVILSLQWKMTNFTYLFQKFGMFIFSDPSIRLRLFR